jgi:hypothetical protein
MLTQAIEQSAPSRASKETLDELRALYKEEFHEELTEDEAREMYSRVMDLYQLLYR